MTTGSHNEDTTTKTARTSIRLATQADHENISNVIVDAFLHDPVYNYFGSLKELIPKDKNAKEKDNLVRWSKFLLNLCTLGEGRVTVLVEHSGEGEMERGRIVGIAMWMTPNKRVSLWQVRKMTRAGVLGMISAWGINGLLRCGFEFIDGTETTMLKAFHKRGLGNPKAAWYLFQIAVRPEYQGKVEGYMSKLVREGFDNAPDAVFALDATTAGSRDKYAHVGFELVGVVPLGKGKCNVQGLKAKGESAVGVEVYSMVKLPST